MKIPSGCDNFRRADDTSNLVTEANIAGESRYLTYLSQIGCRSGGVVIVIIGEFLALLLVLLLA